MAKLFTTQKVVKLKTKRPTTRLAAVTNFDPYEAPGYGGFQASLCAGKVTRNSWTDAPHVVPCGEALCPYKAERFVT